VNAGIAKDTIGTANKVFKNKIGFELIGNPMSLSYERVFYTKNKVSLAGHVGLNLPMIFVTGGFPGVSLGMQSNVSVKKHCTFFVFPKFDLLAISFPIYSGHPYIGVAAFNLLSLNVATGFSFRKKRWEIYPLYPCFMYSFGVFSDGEDEVDLTYPSIAMCSKIAYRF
jgi:hypothetical protein